MDISSIFQMLGNGGNPDLTKILSSAMQGGENNGSSDPMMSILPQLFQQMNNSPQQNKQNSQNSQNSQQQPKQAQFVSDKEVNFTLHKLYSENQKK